MFLSIDAANRVEIAEMILSSFCAVVSQQRTDGPMSSIPKAEGGFNNSVPHLRSRFSVPGYSGIERGIGRVLELNCVSTVCSVPRRQASTPSSGMSVYS